MFIIYEHNAFTTFAMARMKLKEQVMKKEYALEVLNYQKEQAAKWNPNRNVPKIVSAMFLKEIQFLNAIEEIASEKVKGIIKTIKEKRDNKYFKITNKMEFCILEDILSKKSIEELIEMSFTE